MGVWGIALIVLVVSVFWSLLPCLLTPKLDLVWGGHTHKDFKHVETLFRKLLEDGRLPGGAIAAYYKGELIVDLWGGYADLEAQRPWKQDTMTVFYSTTKLIGSLVMARMVDKGLLDYKKPVKDYWPEFAQNGKEKITVEMLLSHQGGLAVLDERISITDLINKQKDVEAKLAKQTPSHVPGSSVRYHGITWGLYVDTLARKVDPKHRSMSQIFQEDIAVPFGIDFYIGTPKTEHHRMARIYPMTFSRFLWQFLTNVDLIDIKRMYLMSPFSKSETFKMMNLFTDFPVTIGTINDPDKAAIGLTSFIGQGTAKGVAKLTSILANGGSYEGKQLLSPTLISRLSVPVVTGFEESLQTPADFGPGTGIQTNPKGKKIFGHSGFGGQVGFADPHTGLGFAYCSNHLSKYSLWDDPVMMEIRDAVYEAIYRIEEKA